MDNSGRSRRDGWIAAGRGSIFPLREVWSGSDRRDSGGRPLKSVFEILKSANQRGDLLGESGPDLIRF